VQVKLSVSPAIAAVGCTTAHSRPALNAMLNAMRAMRRVSAGFRRCQINACSPARSKGPFLMTDLG
jgi:hypothetical protein